MKNVWVIEGGEYSNYRVVGIFSSKENADSALLSLNDDREDLSVEKWILDPGVAECRKGYSLYQVVMLRNGDLYRVNSVPWSTGVGAAVWLREGGKMQQYCVHTWARDDKHAIKIANEKRIQYLAEEG